MSLPSSYDVYTTTKEAWEAMYQAILAAQKSIYWEVYIFIDDEEGNRFLKALEQKAREGLKVKLIFDSWGSFLFSQKSIESLKKAGADIKFFQERKKRYRGIWQSLFARTHRKILVIDEKIGFIGGVNVQKHMQDWLDMQVRIEGKIVHSLLRSFAKMYIICGGEKSEVRHLLKYKFRVYHDNGEFIYDDAHGMDSTARKSYTDALIKARERVILFSPYYFPDKEFLKALWNARKRGIRVDLLIPLRSDLRLVTYAAYFWFGIMKKIGVKVHLLNQMMHGKGVVMDDAWTMIGSSNLEYTSFYDSYEANIKIRDPEFVKKVKENLERWMSEAEHLDDMEWEKRSWLERMKESIAFRLYRLWHRKVKSQEVYLYDPDSNSTTPRRQDTTPKSE